MNASDKMKPTWAKWLITIKPLPVQKNMLNLHGMDRSWRPDAHQCVHVPHHISQKFGQQSVCRSDVSLRLTYNLLPSVSWGGNSSRSWHVTMRKRLVRFHSAPRRMDLVVKHGVRRECKPSNFPATYSANATLVVGRTLTWFPGDKTSSPRRDTSSAGFFRRCLVGQWRTNIWIWWCALAGAKSSNLHSLAGADAQCHHDPDQQNAHAGEQQHAESMTAMIVILKNVEYILWYHGTWVCSLETA